LRCCAKIRDPDGTDCDPAVGDRDPALKIVTLIEPIAILTTTIWMLSPPIAILRRES
jgi:hypothetical protein